MGIHLDRNKEEYRRAYAIKQKLEGSPYRTMARNLDVNYRNVYNWIQGHSYYMATDTSGRTPDNRAQHGLRKACFPSRNGSPVISAMNA
ncbi:MAG: hypothetical protein WAK17_21635 [Candidatus Nitrosopolaris sp.]|jgi:hypothetical protein